MPTAVASAIAPQLSQSHVQQELSPKSSYPALAPSKNSPATGAAEHRSPGSNNSNPPATSSGASDAQPQRVSPDGKSLSPNSSRLGGIPPKIVVKKEPPASPEASATSRHRPRKLDLTANGSSNGPSSMASKPSGGPLTARETSTLALHDVGLACLSPGFQTQDPTMQQQLQRSYSVRDQQRHIIESRLQKSAKATDSENGRSDAHALGSSLRTPLTSKKRNPGLSIVPPSAEQFANERVIQSAPLHQTFTGRHQPHPLTRHVANNQSNYPDNSHIHNVPVPHTANRLPPITDVFANEPIGMNRDAQQVNGRPGPYHGNAPPPSHAGHHAGFPSPGMQGPTSAVQQPSRAREYRSAEEAVAEMASGREELLPKIVHYGGHQPPTPPSPSAQQGLTPNKHPHASHVEASRSSSSRRRMRAEYERDAGSPPLGSGRSPRRGPFGEGRDSPESQRRKKEEFLGLCARAWELFHS